MNDFTYYSPTRVLFGRTALDGLSGLLKVDDIEKVYQIAL